MTQFIDIGANLTNKSLVQDLDAVIKRADQAGVRQIIVTGSSIEDSNQAIRLCGEYPDHLACTAGVHPHHAGDWTQDSVDILHRLADNTCVRAIGETGLDFYRNFSPQDAQVKAYRQQLELAITMKKPVFSHQRDAHHDFIQILREYRHDLVNIVVHCFTDTRAALFEYLDLDCHIGITGWICDERRGTELAQLVKYIPDNRLMVETDSPYLLPRDLPQKPRNRVNEPAYLPHIVKSIAHFQNRPVDRVAADCLKTSQQFFSI
ncbi:MAG: TatD family hydrolase [Proteobacteria bacterium]|nr:TatD family hydrolase [Pseudomonadota bacterium]